LANKEYLNPMVMGVFIQNQLNFLLENFPEHLINHSFFINTQFEKLLDDKEIRYFLYFLPF
jgi:hypothetical protein